MRDKNITGTKLTTAQHHQHSVMGVHAIHLRITVPAREDKPMPIAIQMSISKQCLFAKH